MSDVAIDFAKIFPAAGRQNFFAAREGNAGEENQIPGDNREGRTRAEFCEERRAAHRAIEQHKKAGAKQQDGAKKKERHGGSEVRHEFRHGLFSSPSRSESTRDGVRQPIRQRPACAFAIAEFFYSRLEIRGGKVRPAFLYEYKFRDIA